MEKKKALLIVAGGRGMPDVLALLCVRPQVVAIITSEEGWRDEASFIEIAASLPDHEETIPTLHVESYLFDKIKQACIDACTPYPQDQWDWTFSIGSCPKLMGIAAYEVARQMNIPCIHMDTQHRIIVSPLKDIGISSEAFFHMTVNDYMKIYRREPEMYDQGKIQFRKVVEKWGHIARIVACSPDGSEFINLMKDKKIGKEVSLPRRLVASPLIQALEGYGAIKIARGSDQNVTCAFASTNFATFFGTGTWLEVYVWHEVNGAGFADDCQWGHMIKSTASNELDIALTYCAQLVIAECKSGKDPFGGKTSDLDGVNSKAEMLGRTYVTKVFITNASKTLKTYSNFWEQATLRKIVVATAEDLPDIGSFLKKQAETPDFPRI